MRNIHSTDGTGRMSQHAEPELGRLTGVPVDRASADDSQAARPAATASAPRVAAQAEDGKSFGVAAKHSRHRSADFAHINESRFRYESGGRDVLSLRKISEIAEEDLSPVGSNLKYR